MRRLTAQLVVVLMVAMVTVLAPLRTVAVEAADGLKVVNETAYALDAATGVVKATVNLTLTNTTKDRREGNVINRAYFTGFTVPVPVGSVNPAAVDRDGPLNVEGRLIDGNTEYFVYDIEFGRLFSGEVQRVTLTYDITGQLPRSEIPTRSNPAYVSFFAYGIGDPGEVTVRVIVPKSWQVDKFGDDIAITTEGDNTVYTAADIEKPDEFTVFVSARNDAGLAVTPIMVNDESFEIRSWPGDDEWTAFVRQQLTEGVPALAELIGHPWPIEGTLEVRQANTPYLYGYAGWFSPLNREIEIGEDLDQETVLHELSHAWFNRGLFDERWMSEGYAQVYSNLAIEAQGGTPNQPTKPAIDAVAFNLDTWTDIDIEDADETSEAYGYDASWYVVDQIVDEIGVDKMREVFRATEEGRARYPRSEFDRGEPTVLSWKAFLDYVEDVGGSQTADDMLREWVLDDADDALLDKRAEARKIYQTLVERGAGWAAPEFLRDDMTEWTFDDVASDASAATAVLEQRNELEALQRLLGVPVDLSAEQALYELADADLDDLAADLSTQITATQTMFDAVEAEADEPAFFSKVGLIGTDLQPLIDQGKRALARGDSEGATATAARIERILGESQDVGRRRSIVAVAIALGTLALLALAIASVHRRRRKLRQATEAQPSVDHHPATLFGTDASHGAPDSDDRPLEEIDDANSGDVSDGGGVDGGGD